MTVRPWTLIALLGGCGSPASPACLAYTDAFAVCNDEAIAAGLDVDVDTSDPEGFCATFADIPDSQWDCETAAVQAADCTTDAGLAAMTAALDACRA